MLTIRFYVNVIQPKSYSFRSLLMQPCEKPTHPPPKIPLTILTSYNFISGFSGSIPITNQHYLDDRGMGRGESPDLQIPIPILVDHYCVLLLGGPRKCFPPPLYDTPFSRASKENSLGLFQKFTMHVGAYL